MARDDFYQLLGVKRDASEKDIRQAYRRLARQYHPDVNPGDAAKAERFKKINQAYEVLSDPDKRKKYDKYGDRWEMADEIERQRGASAGTWWSTAGNGGGAGAGDAFDLGGDIGSIFDSLFRRGGRGRPRAPERGQDIDYAVEVSLEEAYHGTTRTLSLRSPQPCETCGGSGEVAGAICHVCEGAGTQTKLRRLEVKIPAGVRTGSRVRMAGEGGGGFAGGPKGDLYLVVTVTPHARFERRGDDLLTDVDVPLVDAVLGGEVEVPTIKGKRVMLTVPPLTQNGSTFRLAGQGMPRLGGSGHGDMYAKVRVQLPSRLSAEERELFERLRALQPQRKAAGVK